VFYSRVYFNVRNQRYGEENTANVLLCMMPKIIQKMPRLTFAKIWMAETRAGAARAFDINRFCDSRSNFS